jgi:hypothetical protein
MKRQFQIGDIVARIGSTNKYKIDSFGLGGHVYMISLDTGDCIDEESEVFYKEWLVLEEGEGEEKYDIDE